jgi:hypothetical protein
MRPVIMLISVLVFAAIAVIAGASAGVTNALESLVLKR